MNPLAHCKKHRVRTHAQKLLALVAGAGAALSSAAVRADVYGYDHGANDKLWGVNFMPDLDQRRTQRQNPFVIGLPGDGAVYCAPTAASNVAAYTTWRGLGPWPQSMDWSSADPDAYFHATINIFNMGEEMDTDPQDGSMHEGIYDGARAVFDGIPFDVNYFQVSGSGVYAWSPRTGDMMEYGHLGGLMTMCYGRYDNHWDADDAQVILEERHMGHCVTPTRVHFRPAHVAEVRWRNPGSGDSVYAQSAYATDVYDVQDYYVHREGEDLWMSMIEIFPEDGRYRMIDSVLVVWPTWGLLDPPASGGNITIYEEPVHPASGTPVGPLANPIDPPVAPTYDPLDFTARPDRRLVACIEQPGPTAPPGTPSRLVVHKTVGGGIAGVVTLLNPKAMTYSRLMELYVIDGGSLVRYWTDTTGITELRRVPLPTGADPVALAYDDRADTVLVLSAVDHAIYRYDHTLNTMLRPVAVEAAGGPDILSPAASATFSLFVGASDSDVWIGNDRANSVGRFRFQTAVSAYRPVQLITSSSLRPTDLQLDNSGRLLVASGGEIREYVDANADGQYEAAAARLYGALRPTRHFEVTRSRSNRLVAPAQEDQWRFALDPSESVPELPDCRADFNGDNRVDSNDFFDFLRAFLGGEFTGDFDYDGSINSADFFAFLTAFFSGC